MSLKNSNDTIGNRTRDLPVCSGKEEHRLEYFESTVLRKILGSNMDDVTGNWSRLHNEELHDLCC